MAGSPHETRRAIAPDGTGIGYSLHPGAPGAPRVALIHSLALDRHFWDAVAEEADDRLTLLALDARGHGASARPPGPYTTDLMADDVAAVLDEAGWDRAIIAGCSMGGSIALAFAARHPGRTAGLVAMDTTDWYGPDAPAAWSQRAETARQQGMAALIPFQRDRWLSPAFLASNPQVQARQEAVFVANDVAAYAASCAMLGTMDNRAATATIRAPAVILVGEQDYATPPAMAEAVAARIPGATFRILEGARHLSPLERPAEIVAAILEVAGRSA
ncbi:alpha/beta fold hydrolase [Muricoccus radiodurans]|uniref:alpha/beta fold hydrolase n=1 Tax=Muricoccus radiodurans TaxID=2231721 RepID=UPI003CE7AE52